MKILMLAPDFGYGGAERSFASTCNLLATEHEVTCVLFNRDKEAAYSLDVPVYWLDPPTPIKGSMSRFWHRVRTLRRLKRELEIDVCVSFLEGADYVNVASGGVTVASIRGSKFHDRNIAGLMGVVRRSLLMPLAYRRFSHVVCVSGALLVEMRDGLGVRSDRVSVLNNFYDFDLLASQATRDLSPGLAAAFQDNEVLSAVGRLDLPKNFENLVRIYARVAKARKQTRLAIVGDGHLGDAILGVAAEEGLSVAEYDEATDSLDTSAGLWLLGYHPVPVSVVARSRLLLVPSRWEGFPNVVIEGIAAGAWTLVADCPSGPREILLPEVGLDEVLDLPQAGEAGELLPIPVDDATIDAWATRILDCLSNPPAAPGAGAISRYSPAAAMAFWRDLLAKF